MFELGKLFWWTLNPGNVLLLLLAAGLAASLVGLRRGARTLWTLAALLALAAALTPARDWLANPLETRFPRPEAPARIDGVILLGGAVSTELSAAWRRPVANGQAGRLVAFAELARRHPTARLVLSGGVAAFDGAGPREADATRDLLVGLGIDPARILVERDSRSTRENAAFSLAVAQPRPGETWVVVTSALHMPRAIGSFRAVNWEVTPWPAVEQRPPTGGGPPLDLLDGLADIQAAAREWLGLAYYRLNGWTDAWLPGPR